MGQDNNLFVSDLLFIKLIFIICKIIMSSTPTVDNNSSKHINNPFFHFSYVIFFTLNFYLTLIVMLNLSYNKTYTIFPEYYTYTYMPNFLKFIIFYCYISLFVLFSVCINSIYQIHELLGEKLYWTFNVFSFVHFLLLLGILSSIVNNIEKKVVVPIKLQANIGQ